MAFFLTSSSADYRALPSLCFRFSSTLFIRISANFSVLIFGRFYCSFWWFLFFKYFSLFSKIFSLYSSGVLRLLIVLLHVFPCKCLLKSTSCRQEESGSFSRPAARWRCGVKSWAFCPFVKGTLFRGGHQFCITRWSKLVHRYSLPLPAENRIKSTVIDHITASSECCCE